MLGEGLAAEIELYECFWGNLVIYTPTQLVGTLMRIVKYSLRLDLYKSSIENVAIK